MLDAALDPKMDGWQRPARRCGVIRTQAVSTRTILLLVRYRFHLRLPTRDGGVRHQIAEDARVLAFRGSPAKAEWLTEQEAIALLDARADENTAAEFAVATAKRILDGPAGALPPLDEVMPHLKQYGEELATALHAAHSRVREASGTARRGLRVIADEDADVLGLYVYLPVTPGTAAVAGEVAR
ncbi:MAG: helicase [Actinomycetia bacterium]|nr:helicase [Actinomycetes bacterium]